MEWSDLLEQLQWKVVDMPLSVLKTFVLHTRHLGSCWKGNDTVCMYVVLSLVCSFPVDMLSLPICGSIWGVEAKQQTSCCCNRAKPAH